jgi:O-antigen/teichoic acid export membrane protein
MLSVQVLLAISGILSARMLGVEGRGEYAFIMAISNLLSLLTLGSSLPVAITTELVRRGVTARDGLRKLFPRWSLLACIPALLAAGYMVVTLDASGPERYLLAVLAAVATLQAIALRVLGGAMQGEHPSVERLVTASLLPPTLSTGLLSIAFVSGWHWDVVDLLISQSVMWTIGLLLGVTLLRKPRHEAADQLDGRPVWRVARANYVNSMAPISSLGLDRTLIGILLGNIALGLYSAATALANLPTLVGSAVGVLLLPRVAAQTSVTAQRRMIGRWLVVGAVPTVAVVVLLVATAEPVIRFAFGAEFLPAVGVARWLIVAQGVLGFRRVLVVALQGLGRGGAASIVELGLTVVLIVGILAAAARDSLVGVAAAMLAVGCLSCIIHGTLLALSLRSKAPRWPRRRVLLVELGGLGHRFYYIRLLAEEALNRGAQVTILTRADPVVRDHIETHLGELLSRIDVRELPAPGWPDVEAFAREWNPEVTVVPEADPFVLRLARRGWRGPGELSLLIMRARVPSSGTPWRSVAANIAKSVAITMLLFMPRIRFRVLRGQTWSRGGWWPSVNDPASLACSPQDVAELRSAWGMEEDRYWVGIVGAVTENKNLPLVVASVADVARDHPVGLLVAGRISPSIQPSIEEFARQLSDAGAKLIVQDRLLTDVELDAAVAGIDCMALAYGHNGPSGTFGKALLAGTRVVAAGSPALRRDCQLAPEISTWVPLTIPAFADALRGAIAAPPPSPVAVPGPAEYAAALLGAPEAEQLESAIAEEQAVHLQDPAV